LDALQLLKEKIDTPALKAFSTYKTTCAKLFEHLNLIPTEYFTERVVLSWEMGGLLSPGTNSDGSPRHWLNVPAHQTATARLANAIAVPLLRDCSKVTKVHVEEEMRNVVEAALVHDAFKRREQEMRDAAKLAGGESILGAIRRTELANLKFLRGVGFSETVVAFAKNTGDMGLHKILDDDTTPGEEIVFYADCCVSNYDIVGYAQRFDDLKPYFEPGGRYEGINAEFMRKYGKTHREMYDSAVLPLERKFAELLKFDGDPSQLYTLALTR